MSSRWRLKRMNNPILAVRIHDKSEAGRALGTALANLPMESHGVESFVEAKELIAQLQPLMVFVDSAIWRAARADILEAQLAAAQFFNVIVVGSTSDIEIYVATLEQGAFEYTAPPFFQETLNRLVQSAAM